MIFKYTLKMAANHNNLTRNPDVGHFMTGPILPAHTTIFYHFLTIQVVDEKCNSLANRLFFFK